MVDPLSVAASAAGLVSLGISVSQSLIDYYNSYRGQRADIDRTISKLDGTLSAFQGLDDALKRRTFREDEQALLEQIVNSINGCKDIIEDLREELEKFENTSKKGLKDHLKATAHRLAYPFRQSTLLRLDEDVRELCNNVSLMLQILGLGDSNRTRDAFEEIKDVLELLRADQMSITLRDWLKAPDATINHREALDKRHPGSGHWLVKSAIFEEWLQKDASFLWVYGFAGTGKSVLCSTAIQYAFRNRGSDQRIGIACFYFVFSDRSKQDVSSMLLALILQLSGQLKTDGQDELSRFRNNCTRAIPHKDDLMKLLKTLLLKFQDVYLFIDALDESPQYTARESVLKTLEAIREFSAKGIHIFVTSRDVPDIRQAIETFGENISMKDPGVDKDIEEMISTALQERQSLRKWSAHHDRILEALTSRAGGVFRWVECQFVSLARCPRSKDALEKVLASLPRSLDETYERILQSIDPMWKEEAKRVLTILCFAKRPMAVPEIIDGIAVDLGDDAKLNMDRRLCDETDIFNLCPGLIEVGENSKFLLCNGYPRPWRTLRIGHFSVQEYLESDRIRHSNAAMFTMHSAVAHAELAQICLISLLDRTLLGEDLPEAVLDNLPLVNYAPFYWYEHYHSSNGSTDCLEKLVSQLFHSRPGAFENWIRINDRDASTFLPLYSRDKSVPIPSAVYYASLLGMSRFLRSLYYLEEPGNVLRPASIYSDLGEERGTYGNALQAASSNGHTDVVRILIEQGADVNIQGGYFSNPLQAASWGGHVEVVRLLIAHGADLSTQADHGTALLAAAWQSRIDVVRLLIAHGAELNPQEDHESAFAAACSCDDIDVVRLFIEQGANVNAPRADLMTPLREAIWAGRTEIMRLLVEKGADVNSGEEGIQNGDTFIATGLPKTNSMRLDRSRPLHMASYYGHIEIQNILLKHGAKFDALDICRRSVLHCAACGESTGAAENFLNYVEALDENHYWSQTALEFSPGTSNNDTAIIRTPRVPTFLLDAFDEDNMTPLLYAIRSGNISLMNLLIDKGASINSMCQRRLCLTYVVKLDPAKYIPLEEGLSPLHAASYWVNLEAVDLLLKRGANANARSEYGETPLHLALNRTLAGPHIPDGWTESLPWQKHRRAGDSKVFIVDRTAERLEVIHRLVNQDGVDLSTQDCDGRTVLHILRYVDSDQHPLISLLVKKGANINSQDYNGETPLHHAVSTGVIDAVKAVIECGPDVTILDNRKQSVLDLAIRKGITAIILCLVSHFDDKGLLEGEMGQSAVRYALGCYDDDERFTSGSKDILEILLEAGISLPHDALALYIQATVGVTGVNADFIEYLIEKGGNTSFIGADGLNLAHIAVKDSISKWPNKVLDLLAAKGVSLSAVDHQQKSILHHAASAGTISIDLLEYLKRKTTLDFCSLDANCMSALDVAKAKVWDQDGKLIQDDRSYLEYWDNSVKTLAMWLGEALPEIRTDHSPVL